ncbi:hypothetical protein ACQP3L_35740, partial [Escherichia coli]
EGRVRIKIEIESGGHAVNTVICPNLFLIAHKYPNSKGGMAKDFFIMIHRTDKCYYLLTSQNIR